MARRGTTELTPRQQQIFDWMKGFIHQHRMPPTVREIGDAFGIKSSSVFDLLKALERKGYIRREPRKARCIVILTNHRLQKRATPAGPGRRARSA